MPNGGYFNQQTIHAAIAAKNVSVEQLHNSCLRIMRGWYALPEAKRLPCGGGICIDNNVSTPARKQLARKLSAMSTVLLKNEGGLLPLSKQAQLKIALIGADASAPYLPPFNVFVFKIKTPLKMQNRATILASDIQCVHVHSCVTL